MLQNNPKLKSLIDDLLNRFVDIVKKTEIIKEKYLRSSQELDNLFNSLSQKAFKGELHEQC